MKNGNTKKKLDGNSFLLVVTIVLFFVMYIVGILMFGGRGFAKVQNFLNLFISNAGLIVVATGMTIVMITGGIDISVGSVVAMVCMMLAWMMEKGGDRRCPRHHHCPAHRLRLWPGAGLPGGVSEDTALYRHTGRHVLCKGHDLHHQPGNDQH